METRLSQGLFKHSGNPIDTTHARAPKVSYSVFLVEVQLAAGRQRESGNSVLIGGDLGGLSLIPTSEMSANFSPLCVLQLLTQCLSAGLRRLCRLKISPAHDQ